MRYWLTPIVTTAAVVAAMSLSTSRAQASEQVPSEPTQPEAKKQLDAGVRAIKAQQWEKAHERLLEAWRIEKHWRIAANLGMVENELQEYRNAAEHIFGCLRNENGLGEKQKPFLEAILNEATAHVATIDVRTEAVGATILVDGEVVGHTPMAAVVFVEPGRRTIMARMSGKSFVNRPVDVVAGETRKVFVPEQPEKMVPLKAPPPKEYPSDWKMVAVPIGAVVTLASLGVGTGYYLGMKEPGISPGVRSDRLIGAAFGYSFAGGAFLTTMLMALWPTEQPQKPRTGLFVAPVVGGGTSGVLVRRSF